MTKQDIITIFSQVGINLNAVEVKGNQNHKIVSHAIDQIEYVVNELLKEIQEEEKAKPNENNNA
jgi:hypothetical protein